MWKVLIKTIEWEKEGGSTWQREIEDTKEGEKHVNKKNEKNWYRKKNEKNSKRIC